YALWPQIVSSRRACAGRVLRPWRGLGTKRKIPRRCKAKFGNCLRILIRPAAKKIAITIPTETSSSPQLTISSAGLVAATDAVTALFESGLYQCQIRSNVTVRSLAKEENL